MLFGFPSPPGGKLPIQARKRPTFPLCSGKVSGPARGAHFSALLCESGVAGFRALLWESRRARAFALCSGEARRATLSRFALAKSTGRQDFRTLLWRSPLCGWTFRLCSGKVRRAGGLSDFALAKSVGAVDFPTLLCRSPAARWTFRLCSGEVPARRSAFPLCSGEAPAGPTFPLCSGEAGAHRFSALLCETDKAAITSRVVFDRQGGCESLGATPRRPRPPLA